MSSSNMPNFNVICADPPWAFGDPLKEMKRKTKRSAISQYKTMSLSEIVDLKDSVHKIVDTSWCVLALWVPSAMLSDGLLVMSEWGFTQKTILPWIKLKKNAHKETDFNNITRVGMGRIFRSGHEVVLIGTLGKNVYKSVKNKSQRSVIFDKNEKHSKKPEHLQDRLELIFPTGNYLEMFARRQRPNWTCLGNEIDGLDIRDAIGGLIDTTNSEYGNEHDKSK